MKAKTRSILTVCLALALVASAVLGTIAYMTATASKTNTFTVGSFNKPTTGPDGNTLEEAAYLVEPNWDENNAKLVPGGSVNKDPKVGIGAGSEDAYIYVYVDNKVLNDSAGGKYVTFTLNDGWEAVTGTEPVTVGGNAYAGGLFKYSTKLEANATADVWTTNAVFSKVTVDSKANTTDFAENPQMIVYAYIHQAKDGSNNSLETTADAAAIAWSENPTGN